MYKKFAIGISFLLLLAIILYTTKTYSYNERMETLLEDNKVVEIYITANEMTKNGLIIREEGTITDPEIFNSLINISPDMKMKKTSLNGLDAPVFITLKLENKTSKSVEMNRDTIYFQYNSLNEGIAYKMEDNRALWLFLSELRKAKDYKKY